jgi:hypothetical protein
VKGWRRLCHTSGVAWRRMPRSPRKYTDEQLAEAVAGSRSMREVLIALGLAPRGGNYETVWRRIDLLAIDASHIRKRFQRGRSVRSCSDQEIIESVAASRSLAQVLLKLGIRRGGNQARLKGRIANLGLETSHFVAQGWRLGDERPTVPAAPLEQVLVIGRLTQTSDLRRRLIQEGLKDARCETCGLATWRGNPIPLELDHVNGVRDDNRLSNLRLLCPNCHAQTPTYRGRNIGALERLS